MDSAVAWLDTTDPKQAEAMFRNLLESAPDAIITVDQDGHIVLVNSQTEQLFGYRREELLGQPVELLLPERLRDVHTLHRATYGADPRTRPMGIGLDLVARRKDGSEFPAEVSLSPLVTEQGTLVTSVIRDITERKRAEQVRLQLAREQIARAEAETTAERLRAIQSITDAALAHLALDDLLHELLGRVRELPAVDTAEVVLVEAEGLHTAPLAATETDETAHSGVGTPLGQRFAAQIAAEGRPVIVEDADRDDVLGPALRKRGIRSLLGVPLLVEGRMIGVLHVGALRPRRFTEDDARLLQLAADRIAIAIDRARLYHEAQEAVRARDRILATVTHDLKSPLTAVKGYAQLLRRKALRLGTPEGAEFAKGLATIDAKATQMATQINELLDAARLYMGRPLQLDSRPTDLVALARQAAAEHAATTEQHRIHVETALPSLVGRWDAARLQRVLDNLLANAIKYSPEGGQIRVTVAKEEKPTGTFALLAVQDQGLGIPATDLPHIFEWFRRARNVVGRIGGSGLGLAGARYIVESHGGTIAAESQEGVGSTFTVRLPLAGPEQTVGA